MERRYRAETIEVAGLPACVLHDDIGDLHATWLVGAGMLGASLIHRDEELPWQGAGAGEYASERKFMGIPFLHPWANRLSGFGYRAGGRDVALDPSSALLLLDDSGLPIHGVLGQSAPLHGNRQSRPHLPDWRHCGCLGSKTGCPR